MSVSWSLKLRVMFPIKNPFSPLILDSKALDATKWIVHEMVDSLAEVKNFNEIKRNIDVKDKNEIKAYLVRVCNEEFEKFLQVAENKFELSGDQKNTMMGVFGVIIERVLKKLPIPISTIVNFFHKDSKNVDWDEGKRELSKAIDTFIERG